MGKRPAGYGDYRRSARYKILKDSRNARVNSDDSDSDNDRVNNHRLAGNNAQVNKPPDVGRISNDDSGSNHHTTDESDSTKSDSKSGNENQASSLSPVPSASEQHDSPRRTRDNSPDLSQNESEHESSESDESQSGSAQVSSDSDSDGNDESGSAQESSDSDNDGNGEKPPDVNDPPLYPGAVISEADSMIAILTFALTHNLSGTCLSDLLELITLHCPQPNRNQTSLYMFRKYFSYLQSPLCRNYYCKYCSSSLAEKNSICARCEEHRGAEYFITVPLIPQLQSLFSRHGFSQKLASRFERTKCVPENYEDVYDGAVYSELSQIGGILSERCNISLAWYTDGIPVFRSSKFSIWPVYLSVFELPYKERAKLDNILLAGLWFGLKKPLPNLFLNPLQPEVTRLKNGLNFQTPQGPMHVKCIIIGGTCDLPAKALFLNMKQFNGKYGCQKCKVPGVLHRPGRGAKRIYPFVRNLDLRTDEETERFAAEAMASGSAVFGVKGPSVLSQLVHFPIRTTVCDDMHCVYQGISKKLLELWFDVQHRNERWSVYNFLENVDHRLCLITPPESVQRLPRGIKENVAYWKASELKAWMLYYSLPVLNGLMEPIYFDHLKLLVLGIFLLSGNSVSEQAVNTSTILLTEFVGRFETLYGRSNLSCNLHQLLHLPQTVRDFGPLWVLSCFPYESLNGKLKKLVSGTRYADLQICSATAVFLNLATLKSERLSEQSPVLSFCNRLSKYNRRMKLTALTDSLSAIGKLEKKTELPGIIQNALGAAEIQGRNYSLFYRLYRKADNSIFISESYTRTLKTKSSCMKYEHTNRFWFGIIQSFVKVSYCRCIDQCNECNSASFAIVLKCDSDITFTALPGIPLNHIHAISFSNEILAVDIGNLLNICYFIRIRDNDSMYLVEPVNTVEVE